jgi:regulator of replication initiation timing
MPETIKNLLISLIPSITSIAGCVAIAIKTLKEVKNKFRENDISLLRKDVSNLNKKLYELLEENKTLREENRLLVLERKGLKQEYEKKHIR